MGDKPVKIPNEHYCPGSPWPDYLEPDLILAVFFDIEKGPDWTIFDPEPPNGAYFLQWYRCNSWRLIAWPFAFVYMLIGSNWEIRIDYMMDWLGFYDVQEPSNEFYATNQNLLTPLYYQNGHCVADLAFDGSHYPQSWLPAPLVPVPELGGYFAEQGYSGLDDKHFRYCNHSNRSNLKLILDN